MATLTIKNLPDDIYAALTQQARQNRRSINGEAIIRLERALQNVGRDDEALIKQIRRTRKAMERSGVWLTDDLLRTAKNEGRP